MMEPTQSLVAGDPPALSPAELARRIAFIRFPPDRLAAAAGVHTDVVRRTINKVSNPRWDTVQKLSAAVIAEERRLFSYLSGLPTTVTGSAA